MIETDPWNLVASEFTWHSDGTINYNTTRGNNGNAQANWANDEAFINDPRPFRDDLIFDFPYDPATVDTRSYVNASVTQLFYTANMYHDLLYVLGFNEVAGNFEVNNNGQGGLGADPPTLNAQDGAGLNNANFATPADGRVPRMRMYLWTTATPRRDCAFDSSVIIHEYTHGVSNRLTGGPQNVACLDTTTESGGMGEGWGDFMAIAIYLKTTDTRAVNYPLGDWVANDPGGIRVCKLMGKLFFYSSLSFYPESLLNQSSMPQRKLLTPHHSGLYSTDKTTNPSVYTTANGSTLVHFIGEIWANMLYEVLWNLIDAHGITDARHPTYVDGVPTDGRFLAMQLVIDGMKL